MKEKLVKRIAIKYYKTKFRSLAILSPKIAAESAFQLFCKPYSGKPKRIEPSIFKKADVIQIKVNGITVRGWHWKTNEANSKNILIAHGFDSFSYRFEKYVQPLLTKGYNVLAFDAPGHGISEGKTLHSLQYKEVMIAIHKQLGPLSAIMGHSMGGLAASLAAEEIKTIEKLVLIAPAVEITRAIQYFTHYVGLSNPVKEAFNNYILDVAQQPISYFDVGRAIEYLSTSILWLHDKEDKICPYIDVVPVQRKQLSHIQFYITKGLGHSKIYREQTSLKAIIDFL